MSNRLFLLSILLTFSQSSRGPYSMSVRCKCRYLQASLHLHPLRTKKRPCLRAQPFYTSKSSNQSAADASDGIRQSPLGDSDTEPTLGPSGRQLLLNCCVKNLLKKFPAAVTSSFTSTSGYALIAYATLLAGSNPYLNV